MIKVLFFAQVRELVGVDSLELQNDYSTVDDLRRALINKGDRWALALEDGKLLSAVNQSFVQGTYAIKDGDEVAFFPPVTGAKMSTLTRISVQNEHFNVGDEYQWLSECESDGAVVTFTGKVRNHNLGDEVNTLTLEHYPGMTEKALNDIVEQARARWPLQRVSVIHRVGPIKYW